MAKKTTPTALQTEISNNEEWKKLLTKTGLIGKYKYLFKIRIFFLFSFFKIFEILYIKFLIIFFSC